MRKRHTLKNELTVFMLLASVVTLMLVAIAVCYVFFSFFFKNTQEDIEYVLNNTTQQYQSHMQFIEDGAISIRHNSLLGDFFQTDSCDADIAKEQLMYSMELFADRNQVNQQLPFVTSVYLFNNWDQCIKEYYYAITLASEKQQEKSYTNMQQWFKKDRNQYACVTDSDNLNILFRIYDDDMKEKGIGIAQISLEAIEGIFEDIEGYQDYSWSILSHNNLMLVSGGDATQNDLLKEKVVSWSGNKNVEGRKVIVSADASGFGLRTIIAVGQNNILAILRPTLIIFLLGLVIVLILTFLVSYGISYRFTKPATRMIANIRAFGRKELNVRMEDSSIQEFHDIGQVFNEMADRIEYLITEVYEKQLLATQSQVKYLQSQLNPHFQFNIFAFKLVFQFFQMRQFSAARPTPGCPNININIFTGQIFQSHLFTIDIQIFKFRRRLSFSNFCPFATQLVKFCLFISRSYFSIINWSNLSQMVNSGTFNILGYIFVNQFFCQFRTLNITLNIL